MGMANVGNIHRDAADILKGAREKITRGGWVQHAEKSGSAYCMIGAMKASDGTKPEAMREAERIVNNLTGIQSVINYNDAPGRTKEHVLEILQAAENCEKEMV